LSFWSSIIWILLSCCDQRTGYQLSTKGSNRTLMYHQEESMCDRGIDTLYVTD